jgi:Na+/melibiose symporter-like transporter
MVCSSAADQPKPDSSGVTEPARAPSPGTPLGERDPSGKPLFRCGTLTYTMSGLVVLFAWLLWSNFCYTLLQTVVPSILPLKLKALDSDNWTIGLIMSTLPGIFNTTVCPWVSFKSDRYRSRWGRRMPFILYTMPFLVASLVCIGLCDPIAAKLHSAFLSQSALSRNLLTVLVLAAFAGCFHFFNMFVGSVYWYLFNDVVPEQFLSRFMAYFRLVGTLAAAFYNYFIFKYYLSHKREIFIGTALLYLIGFGLACIRVKEGQYPPPSYKGKAPSLSQDLDTFARECYTMPYYWYIFLYCMFGAVAGSIGVFSVFFNQSMGLDLNLIGKMGAVGGLVVAGCYLFAGTLVDKWHPVRVDMYLHAYGTFFTFGGLIWLFAEAPPSQVYFWVGIVGGVFSAVMSAMQSTAGLPQLMILFPKDRFGQFCGAQALVRSAGTMIGGLIAGVYLDVVRRFYPPGDLYPYRFIFFWTGAFTVLAFYFHYRAYRCWKRLGGDTGYVPPTANFRYAALPPAATHGVVRPLLLPPLAAFIGAFVLNLFYVGYFGFVAHHGRNTLVFSVYAGIMLLIFMAYLRFVRYMERP